jgi:hypothetical protein
MPPSEPQFQIAKVSDEGSSDPFIARVFYGILRLRDGAIQHVTRGVNFEQRRKEFDDLYNPVLTAITAARKATGDITVLVSEHSRKIADGTILSFQPRAVSIAESIDAPLHDAVSRLLVQGVIALKAIQPVTRFFHIDIGSFFQKMDSFARGVANLKAAGHIDLATYLQTARDTWTEEFIAQRAALEHQGWTLPRVRYVETGERSYRMEEPRIGSVPISAFAVVSVWRLQALVENVVVYAMTTVMQPMLALEEIPAADRDPTMPVRFRYTLKGTGSEWRPRYDERDFG